MTITLNFYIFSIISKRLNENLRIEIEKKLRKVFRFCFSMSSETRELYSLHIGPKLREEWKKITPGWKAWDYSYYKGLGTNNKEDIVKDAQNPKMVDFVVDEKTREKAADSVYKAVTD